MEVYISRVGTSQGIRLNKNILLAFGLSLGDVLEVRKTADEIILKPKHGANWFLEDYQRPNEEESWEYYNEPKGREVW